MDQPERKPGFTKPIGGFVVVLAVAVLVGVWLYVDMVKNELEMKVDRLSDELESAKRKERAEAEKEPAPPAAETEEAWRTFSAELGGQRFQIDLPDGHRLTFTEGGMGDAVAYVVLEPTPENEAPIPDMVISLVSLQNEMYAARIGKDEPGTRLVATADGEWAFWIRGWEDMEWPLFGRAAASFKPL